MVDSIPRNRGQSRVDLCRCGHRSIVLLVVEPRDLVDKIIAKGLVAEHFKPGRLLDTQCAVAIDQFKGEKVAVGPVEYARTVDNARGWYF